MKIGLLGTGLMGEPMVQRHTDSLAGIRQVINKAIELGFTNTDYSSIFSAIKNL